MVKCGLTGTSCSGKTTLSKQLAKYFNFQLIPEIARRYKKEELHDIKNERIEYNLILQQIDLEIFAKNNIITDRTIIDPYIYLERKGYKPRLHLLNLVRNWSQNYDIIILCRKLPFIDDHFREDNLDIENEIISFMKNNLIEFEIVEGNESERFEKAKEIINKRML